jgi:hypothetical protein
MHRLGATLVVILLVAGCGQGDNSGGSSATDRSSTAAMSKAQFVSHFNDLCRRGWPLILRNAAEYASSQSPHLSSRRLFEKTFRYSFMAGFDYYIFSKAHELGVNENYESVGQEVIAAMKDPVERGLHREWFGSPAQVAALFAPYNRVARRYGLGDCLVAGPHLPRG